jgi:hypothetical protein
MSVLSRLLHPLCTSLLPQFERQDPNLRTQSHCAFQASKGNPGIGEAEYFLSWHMNAELLAILERTEEFVEENGLDPDNTFVWVCVFSVRQSEGNKEVCVRVCVCFVCVVCVCVLPARACTCVCLHLAELVIDGLTRTRTLTP